MTALVGKPPYLQHINTITDYTLYIIIALWDYYFYTGDIDFVRFIYSRIKGLISIPLLREKTMLPGTPIFLPCFMILQTRTGKEAYWTMF